MRDPESHGSLAQFKSSWCFPVLGGRGSCPLGHTPQIPTQMVLPPEPSLCTLPSVLWGVDRLLHAGLRAPLPRSWGHSTDSPVETFPESHGGQGTGVPTLREGSWRQIPHHQLTGPGLQAGFRQPGECMAPARTAVGLGGGALVLSLVRFCSS